MPAMPDLRMIPDDTLPAPGETRNLMLPAAGGQAECLLSRPRAAVRGVAVIAHPHPLFGGAMSNKVVYTLASCAQKAGLVALRFNFRGVGRSEGVHDHGIGETEDVVALASGLRTQWPGVPLALLGFSFGAFVTVRAAERLQPQALVSIAPPFSKYVDHPVPPPPGCPWLVLHSTDDEVVAYEETVAILRGFAPPPQLLTLEGAGHFFHGRLGDIERAVLPFLNENLP